MGSIMACRNKNWIVALIMIMEVFVDALAFAADKRTVVDSAGRLVEVPRKIERVFAAGGPASIFMYTLAPEKLLGWNSPLTPEERAYIPTPYAGLPTLGRLTGAAIQPMWNPFWPRALM